MPASMTKAFLLTASLVVLLGMAPLQEASAAVVSKQFPSDIDGIDLLVSCEPGPIATDYAAETASGVPLTDPYAVARDADKGLIDLMSRGGKQVKRYGIPRQRIRAIVKIKYEMDVLDRADLIFTASRLVLVHTFTTNAGIFTVSDVYELAPGRNQTADSRALKGDPQLLHTLSLGLSAYRPATGKCTLD
jgi:hypothetical protein